MLVPGAAATLVGAHLTLSFARDLVHGRASRRWPQAPGRVVGWGGHAGSASAHDSTAALTYEYEVAGRTYTSRRVDYVGHAGIDAGAVLARYALGADVVVHYDPLTPDRAVLQPGIGVGNVVRLALVLPVLAAGLALLATA